MLSFNKWHGFFYMPLHVQRIRCLLDSGGFVRHVEIFREVRHAPRQQQSTCGLRECDLIHVALCLFNGKTVYAINNDACYMLPQWTCAFTPSLQYVTILDSVRYILRKDFEFHPDTMMLLQELFLRELPTALIVIKDCCRLFQKLLLNFSMMNIIFKY